MKILEKLKKASDTFEYLTSSKVRTFFLGVILCSGIGYLVYQLQESRKDDLKAIIDFKNEVISDSNKVIESKNAILTDCQNNIEQKENEIREMLASKEEDCHKLVKRSIKLVNDLKENLQENIMVSSELEKSIKSKYKLKTQ